MNARFWTYHPVADSFVKLTLKPGQTLHHWQGWPTDEGWSSAAMTWSFDGEVVCREVIHDGQDCDGRLTTMRRQQCALADLRVMREDDTLRDHKSPWLPDWSDVSSSQRDYAAEAMGY